MSSSSQATTRSNGLTLFSLSGELRNKIYRAHFDELRDADFPRNQSGYIFATAVRSFLNVFEVSQQVYAETHGMFFAEYFPRSHYVLEGLRAMQTFVKLPGEWRNDKHALRLRSRDPDVGLEYLSIVEAVLRGTTSLISRQYTGVSFQHEENPLQRVKVAFRGSWDRDWQECAL